MGGPYLHYLNKRIAGGESVGELLGDAEVDELVAMYDAGVFWVDEQLGRLFAELDTRGLAEETVWLVTADHGEAFGQHRFLLHQEVWDPLLRVPLIVHDPRDPTGRVLREAVTLMDVAATILDLAHVPTPRDLDGQPLPVLEAAREPRSLFAYRRFRESDDYRGYALREGDLKLVVHGDERAGEMSEELYDLARDPQERAPLTGRDSRRREMAARLRARMRSLEAPGGDKLELPPETRRQLEALGYGR